MQHLEENGSLDRRRRFSKPTGPAPRKRRIQTLAEFSEQFFVCLDSLPTDRPAIEATKKYYRTGWRLVQATKLAGMRIDQITEDEVRATATFGSSPTNTNNALRTLRHMLKQAYKWKQIAESHWSSW